MYSPPATRRAEALVAVQVTTRSPIGAIIYETGGLLIDHGWLRVLGSGHPRLPRSLPGWNKGRTRMDRPDLPAYCLIADDVLGGFFALNGGDLPGEPRHVRYFRRILFAGSQFATAKRRFCTGVLQGIWPGTTRTGAGRDGKPKRGICPATGAIRSTRLCGPKVLRLASGIAAPCRWPNCME